MSRGSAGAVAVAALALVVACSEPSAPAAPAAPAARSMGPAAPASAPAANDRPPVPELVAKLHRTAFDPNEAEPGLGRVLCFVTLHDAALTRGEVFPLVLFADGSVATWRQTSSGSKEPFFAKLGAGELSRASELCEAIPAQRKLARETLDASALVMGVSTRAGERVETFYFDNARLPPALGELVGILKGRLEATNRR